MSAQNLLTPNSAGNLAAPPGYYNNQKQPILSQAANSFCHTMLHDQSRDFSNPTTYMNGNNLDSYDPEDTQNHKNSIERNFSSAQISTDSEGGFAQEDENAEYLGEAHLHDDEVDHLNQYATDYAGNPKDSSVKLFVGQVPKTMEEEGMLPIFVQFGPVEKVSIIRDRQTGHHRGCAFVTYTNKADAEACEFAFHDKYILPDAKKPVQIRPASANGTLFMSIILSIQVISKTLKHCTSSIQFYLNILKNQRLKFLSVCFHENYENQMFVRSSNRTEKYLVSLWSVEPML